VLDHENWAIGSIDVKPTRKTMREFVRRFWVSYQQMPYSSEMIAHWRVWQGELHLNAAAVGFDALTLRAGGGSDGMIAKPDFPYDSVALIAAKSSVVNALIIDGPVRSIWCSPSLPGLQRHTVETIDVPWHEELRRQYVLGSLIVPVQSPVRSGMALQ